MAWTEGETRTYVFNGASEADSKYDVSLDAGEYEIVVHGADGAAAVSGATLSSGGVGGYINGTFTASSNDNLEIWVGESTQSSNGGWGRSNGGSGASSSEVTAGGGGGSTEILLNGNFLAAADAGGGGGVSGATGRPPSPIYVGGGGGARGGLGGTADEGKGSDAQGTGNGGDGGDVPSSSPENGSDGGQEAGSALTVDTATKGGSTHPDSTRNGYVEITYQGAAQPALGSIISMTSQGVIQTDDQAVVTTKQ